MIDLMDNLIDFDFWDFLFEHLFIEVKNLGNDEGFAWIPQFQFYIVIRIRLVIE